MATFRMPCSRERRLVMALQSSRETSATSATLASRRSIRGRKPIDDPEAPHSAIKSFRACAKSARPAVHGFESCQVNTSLLVNGQLADNGKISASRLIEPSSSGGARSTNGSNACLPGNRNEEKGNAGDEWRCSGDRRVCLVNHGDPAGRFQAIRIWQGHSAAHRAVPSRLPSRSVQAGCPRSGGLPNDVDGITRDLILFAAAGENIKVYNPRHVHLRKLEGTRSEPVARQPDRLHRQVFRQRP